MNKNQETNEQEAVGKSILYFEDSSKVTFGGGQEMSLLILTALKQDYSIQIFDYAAKSIFLDRVKQMGIRFCRLHGYGKLVHHNHQSFTCGLMELMLFPFFLPVNFFQVIKIVLKEKPFRKNPLLFCSTNKVLVLAVLLSYFIKCRIIYYAHNINDRNRLISRLFNLMLRRCSTVFGVSRSVCDSLPVATELLPGAIEITNEQIKPREINGKTKICVAVLASLQRWKGIDNFVKSYTSLVHKDLIEYWIYGEGPEKDTLKALADNNPGIFFKGFTDFRSIKDKIDIIVLPSVKPEAFGMNIIKANSWGIPVIATDIGAHSELLEDQVNGCLIAPGDPSAIAKKIDYLIDNPEIYLRISQGGIDSSRKFDFSKFKEKLLNYL